GLDGMSVRRRRTRDGRRDSVGRSGGGTALAVVAFECVEGGDTALARLTGTWSGDRAHPADVTLVVSRPSGEERSFAAHVSVGLRTHLEGARWEVAFSLPVELAESRMSKFSLKTDAETIALPRPRPHRAPATAVERD